jgi:hypothetical protein
MSTVIPFTILPRMRCLWRRSLWGCPRKRRTSVLLSKFKRRKHGCRDRFTIGTSIGKLTFPRRKVNSWNQRGTLSQTTYLFVLNSKRSLLWDQATTKRTNNGKINPLSKSQLATTNLAIKGLLLLTSRIINYCHHPQTSTNRWTSTWLKTGNYSLAYKKHISLASSQ